MRSLLLARHGHARANELEVANGVPPGEGLTTRGVAEARALADAIAADDVSLAVATAFVRCHETVELALAGRDVPTIVVAELGEISYGSFEDGPLTAYLEWAWVSPPDAGCPGGGESRADAVRRVASALTGLAARDERAVLVVSHGAIVRWVLDAAAGKPPAARLEPVGYAELHRLDGAAAERAARRLAEWAEHPQFAEHDDHHEGD